MRAIPHHAHIQRKLPTLRVHTWWTHAKLKWSHTDALTKLTLEILTWPLTLQENFNQTPSEAASSDSIPSYLQGKDPDTPVMMYCTGGIRCDVYSAHLRDKGFTSLYTLEGGIQNYLKEEGHDMWNGSLFVFDGRMAVPSGEHCMTHTYHAVLAFAGRSELTKDCTANELNHVWALQWHVVSTPHAIGPHAKHPTALRSP